MIHPCATQTILASHRNIHQIAVHINVSLSLRHRLVENIFTYKVTLKKMGNESRENLVYPLLNKLKNPHTISSTCTGESGVNKFGIYVPIPVLKWLFLLGQ